MKAAAVAAQVDDGVVLAADTVGWCDGQPVLKPADEADARRILHMLGRPRSRTLDGRLPLAQARRRANRLAGTQPRGDEANVRQLRFRHYLQTRQWEGCSGAYAIQEENDPLLTVEGSVSNVIGLPMESLSRRIWPFV